MDTVTLAFIWASLVLLAVWLLSKRDEEKRRGGRKVLRGPRGLPVVGYLPFLTAKPYIKLTELAKEYGPVYRVRLGAHDVVCLCDFQSIKEAFSQDAFMGRPALLPFNLSKTSTRTQAFTGMPWRYQRRFALQQLRALGFGKTTMEGHMNDEIEDLLDRIKYAALEGSVRISRFLTFSMSNNISSLLFGRRMLPEDENRMRLDRMIQVGGRLARATTWQIFFPWVRAFLEFFNIGSAGLLQESLEVIKTVCVREVDHHVETLDESRVRDFIDGYLIEIKKSTDPAFHKDVLTDVCRAFLAAGSETVRVSVEWSLLICADKPEVQTRMQQEIDATLGDGRFATWQDRLTMPYTEAAICEMWRWITMVPINVMRCALQDTEVNGFFIKKNTQVLAVLHTVDKDEKLWGPDVGEYRPERFLSKDGKKVEKPEYFIPFSIGRRTCPGRSLAEIEVFLYVVAILQKFRVSLPAGKKADYEGSLGITYEAKPQQLCFELRN